MKTGLYVILAGIFATAFVYSCSKNEGMWDWMIPETEDSTTTAEVNGYVFRPALVSATADNIGQLKVPPGFAVGKFADSLGKPRIIASGGNGNIYVSDREAGVVMLLEDANSDGIAETRQRVAEIPGAHGLTVHNSILYIAAVREIYSATINGDGTLGMPKLLTDKLPDGGQHPNRTLAVGADNMLYVSIGSTCNACAETNPLNATIARANLDGSNLSIYAKGLRNTIGFAWHPATGELWAADHGIDWLGDEDQKEELNQIKQNAHFGWPYIYGEGKYNPADSPPGDTTYQQYLAMTTLPTQTYQAHAAPMQMVFYTGTSYPDEFRNDAFIAFRGSWNRSQPVGYSVVRIHFENGKPVSFEDFLTGFLVNGNKSHFGRPVGLAVHSDGSLLVGDDTNGVIYRIYRN